MKGLNLVKETPILTYIHTISHITHLHTLILHSLYYR